ncbi:MAG: hypothetical protein PHG66_00180 [Candidatus Colwellbacteria bacterium]|nr:hypothetical protein [Candidatus Colwellbacteria bacterium]
MPSCYKCKTSFQSSRRWTCQEFNPDHYCYECISQNKGKLFFNCPCCVKSTRIMRFNVDLYMSVDHCQKCDVKFKCEKCNDISREEIPFDKETKERLCSDCHPKIKCDICIEEFEPRNLQRRGIDGKNCCSGCRGINCDDVHKTCMMDNGCCFCRDKRSYSSSYSGYLDGVGYVYNKKREDFYCNVCRENTELFKCNQKN